MKVLNQAMGKNFAIYHGDSCEVLKGIPDNSIHYSVTSIPFASLYTYSNSDRDLGNCRSYEEFAEQYMYLGREWFRVMMPGRNVSVHCMNLPTSKERDGYIGIRDFRGDVIRWMQSLGFIYHSEVCIWKNPVTAMQRTKALGLLHKQIKKDSCMSRQGIPDYVVTFRKPGDNSERVTHTNESYPVSHWQQVASPIWEEYATPTWWDINQSDTLNRKAAKEEKDERHICPLQLPVIERCVELWSNPGDIVMDPFDGIGSTGYQSLLMGQRTSMWSLIPQKLMPPTRLVRYCCAVLKETGGAGRFIATGVRWAESVSRKNNRGIYERIGSTKNNKIILNNDNDDKRMLFENCRLKAKRVVNPIIDWQDDHVFGFLEDAKCPMNPLYSEGWRRVGCVGCPMAGKEGRELEFARWPKYKNLYLLAFEKLLAERAARGMYTSWQTPEDVFNWWMEYDILPGQMQMEGYLEDDADD